MRRSWATVASTAALAVALATLTAPPASAAPLSIDGGKVLDLSFEGGLADSSGMSNAVTMQKGSESYATGLDGQAFNFTGAQALRLGTGAHLQPEDLTVSFWYNPNVAMAGEQVFAWSKLAYNSPGWYLTSESNSVPLALSVGPASSQPYKVAVDANRSTFFPAGQWTHIVATYDSADKSVAIYRNGVRQVTTVKFPATGDATGVIAGESTTVKTIGYNGPQYNGAHLNGRLDDYRLYDGVATLSDVVTLTQENDPTFDPTAIAESDLEMVSVPAAVNTDFAVPITGARGSEITWTSSRPDAVAVAADGGATVTPGSAAVDVQLTATASYGGSEPAQRVFDVRVEREGVDTSLFLLESGLENVSVQDPYLVNANQKTVEYLLSLDPERFLYSWYVQAGLPPTTTSGYGGWERATGTRFQGHFFGHYISALSQSYSTTTDPAVKAQLLEKLTAAVDGLDRAQKAYAAANPTEAGFVAPFPISALPSGRDGLLVPFYNLHKVLAGLIDAHQQAPDDVAATALRVADGFGSWVTSWAGRQANPAAILNTEYGGMNEALYELYEITEKPAHKRAAEYFDEVTLFQNLAAGRDVLNGLHANTTIPKLVGALKRYTLFSDNPHLYALLTPAEKSSLDMYRVAAENFWQIVVDDHTYANGANSQSEHFHGPDELHEHATNGTTTGYGENSTAEGCNEYNMLKLSRALFQVTQDVKYLDYYEGTYINTILASQNPETGMVTYFQPMTAGYAKVFGRPYDEFWCDHGTGIESFTKLNDSIYYADAESVYVAMFRSSTFDSAAHNLRLVQTANVPSESEVGFEVQALDGGELAEGTTLRLRVPDWLAGAPTLEVNGQVQDVAAMTADGFVSIEVAAGDTLSYTLPAKVEVDDSTENPRWVAFKYGPVLLATELSRSNVDATYLAGVLVRMSVADKSLDANVLVDDAEAWKADIEENLVRVADRQNPDGSSTMQFALRNVDPRAEARVFEPWYSLYGVRYAIYSTLIEPDSPESQAQILRDKEQLRIAETTIDSLTSFDNNNSEADKNYKFNKSAVGVHLGQGYRDAQMATDAWFQYDMIVDPDLPVNYLGVRYFGGDNGRTFSVYVNDVLLKNERVTNAQGSNTWYVQYDAIPQAVIDGIAARDSYKRDQNGAYVLDDNGEKVPVVTVRFQGNGTSYVGGVYGVYTASTTGFATDASLTALGVSPGALEPAFDPAQLSYVVTVPADATSVELDADPNVPSGLVYVGDVLIDDRKPRTIPLAAEGDTNVAVRSVAQDHRTSMTYDLTFVRESAEPTLDVAATATARCIAGKVTLAVQVTNRHDAQVALLLTTPYGSKSATAAAGKTVSYAFSSRLAAIEGGTATVTASATIDGSPVSVTIEAPYAGATCR